MLFEIMVIVAFAWMIVIAFIAGYWYRGKRYGEERKRMEYGEQVKTVKKRLEDCTCKEERDHTLFIFALDLSYSRAAICQAISEFEKEHMLGEYKWMRREVQDEP